jgi:hypothetical protein
MLLKILTACAGSSAIVAMTILPPGKNRINLRKYIKSGYVSKGNLNKIINMKYNYNIKAS